MRTVITQTLLKRVAFVLPVTLVGLFASANAYGNVILDNILNNSGFEAGTTSPNNAATTTYYCPVSWSCSGSPSPGDTAYQPNNNYFTPGTDGIAGNTPGGTWAGYAPTVQEGTGTISQLLTAGSPGQGGVYAWTADTYLLNLWIGTPKVELPSVTCAGTLASGGCALVGPVTNTIRANFYANGAAVAGIDLAPGPAVGHWVYTPLTFDARQYVGQTIGFSLTVTSSGTDSNDRVANFDVAAVPEPASFALMGLGLLGLGVVRKRLQR